MKPLLIRKLATVILVTVSVAAFATLGDGGKKSAKKKSLLSSKSYSYNYRTFSLKSGYNYRGSTIITPKQNAKFIMLNTVITYQKGSATYILPMKKKVLLDKVNFNPASSAH